MLLICRSLIRNLARHCVVSCQGMPSSCVGCVAEAAFIRQCLCKEQANAARGDVGAAYPFESKLPRCASQYVADALPAAHLIERDVAPAFAVRELYAPATRPLLARAQCCVAPSLCWPASKCVARPWRRRLVQLCAKPRATGRTCHIACNWHSLAFSRAIGSTWIRRERHTKHLPQYQVRTTASPEFSHRLGSRDAVFISGAALPMTALRRPMPSTLRKPRS